MSTIWIWDLSVAELRAVLIFHANVSNVSWHPCVRELLLVTCEGDDHSGLVFIWDSLSKGPKSIDFARRLPDHKIVGKPRVAWLWSEADPAAIFFSDNKVYLLASLAEPDSPPFPCLSGDPGDEFAIETPAAEIDQDLSALGNEDISEMDDTFSFKRT